MSGVLRKSFAAGAFVAAAACFGLGLAGRSGSWLAAMVGSLVLLTVGFYLAAGTRQPAGRTPSRRS